MINLSTGYGTHAVARGISCVLHQGEVVSLLGTNGAGKSTLLRTIAAFQPPLQGQIYIQGTPLDQLSATQRSRLIGIVLTERFRIQGITVRDLVGMGRNPHTGFWGRKSPQDEQQVDEALHLVGITELQHRHADCLSDGELQKVMIAKALAQDTPLILLDEPTAFLDFPSKVETLHLLRRMAHQMHKSILLSTHDVELALQMSDRIWLLSSTGIVAGTPSQLAHDGHLTHFFTSPHLKFNVEKSCFEID